MSAGPPPPIIPGDSAFLDHSSQGYKTIIAAVVCMVIATFFVGLRTYTRKIIAQPLWFDDYLAIFSAMLVIAQGVEACIHVKVGAGRHVWDIQQPDGLILFNKHFYASFVLYNVSLFFVKQTLFFQYYRIFRNVVRLRQIYIGVMVLITLWMASQLIIIGLLCIPIDAYWDEKIPGKCLPIGPKAQMLILSIGNIVTDVIILVLPIPVVLRLKLRKHQKVSLLGIFSLGLFACLVSLFRVVFVNLTPDFTYDSISLINWSIAEVVTGLVCGVLPTLKPLVSKWLPSMRSLGGYSSRGYQRYNDAPKQKDGDPCPAVSNHDTGVYGLSDFGVDLERPHPVKLHVNESCISKHPPKHDGLTPIRLLDQQDDQWWPKSKVEGSQDEICPRPERADDPLNTARPGSPRPGIHVRVNE